MTIRAIASYPFVPFLKLLGGFQYGLQFLPLRELALLLCQVLLRGFQSSLQRPLSLRGCFQSTS